MKQGDMSISAFSRRSLLSVKALRLYDEMSLLRPEHVDPTSKYRYYSESQIETARLISLLRKLDVPLAAIAIMIHSSPQEASAALAEWWEGEVLRMAGRADLLQYIRGSVLGDVQVGASSVEPYAVDVRQVPMQTYLYCTRHLHGPQLPSFIEESTAWLLGRAERYGGAQGPVSLMFHGQVDLDSDGPVDACLPIAKDSIPVADDLIRTEAAHLQAYTRLRKHQLVFPQILQVYQLLRRWANANGYAISGLPREIYIADFGTVEADQPVCEVAYPIQHLKGSTNE